MRTTINGVKMKELALSRAAGTRSSHQGNSNPTIEGVDEINREVWHPYKCKKDNLNKH